MTTRWWGWRGVPVVSGLLGCLLAWLYATRGTLSPFTEYPYVHGTTWFYSEQLRSILDGRLDVTTGLLTDCYLWQERCYGYFGITPSLLRLPVHPLPLATSWSPLLVWLACALGIVLSLGIVTEVWRLLGRLPSGDGAGSDTAGSRLAFTLAAVAVSAANPLLLDLSRTVYEEAVAWGATFVLAALLLFLRWWSSPGWGYGIGMVACLVAASNARVGTIIVGVPLSLAVLLVAHQRGRIAGRMPIAPSLLGLAAAIAVLPVLGAVGVFYLKFDVLVPSILLNVSYPEDPVLGAAYAAAGGSLASAQFIPTTLWAYLRPDSLTVDPAAPLGLVPRETFTLLWPTPTGSIVIEQAPGVLALAPLSCLLTVAALAWTLRILLGRAREGSVRTSAGIWLAILAAAAAPTAAILAFHYLVLRYTMDFTAILVVGTALGSALLAPLLTPLQAVRAVAGTAAAVLVGWSVLAINAVAIDATVPYHVPGGLPAPPLSLQQRGHVCPGLRHVAELGPAGVSGPCATALARYADGDANAILARSADPTARAVVATLADAPLLRTLATDADAGVRAAVAGREFTPPDVLAALAADPDPTVRASVARNPETSALILVDMFTDPDPAVAAAARANPRSP